MGRTLCIILDVLLGLIALSAAPAASQTHGVQTNGEPANTSPRPRVLAGSASTAVTAAEGYSAYPFAQQLGQISALARDESGRLYAADQRGGRILILTDRNLDGRLDTQRSLPHRFDTPSGIAATAQGLFIADRAGVWSISADGTPRLLAALSQSRSIGAPHALTMREDGVLRLGYTRDDGTAHVVSIDLATGRAAALASQRGQFLGWATGPDAPLWILSRNTDHARLGANLMQGAIVPDDAAHVWLDAANNQIILSTERGVFRAAAGLGRLEIEPEALMSGLGPFDGSSLRAGPVLTDERGLFIADPKRGTLWRLVPDPPASPDKAVSEPDVLNQTPLPPPAAPIE